MNLKEFIDPPKQNRPLADWAWNGDMEPAEIDTQARDMKRKGYGGFIIHASSGLKTTYLGDDWLKAVRRAVEIANELKMEAWVHDEDRSPSGYAGGKITKNNKDFAPVALVWTEDTSSMENETVESGLVYTRRGETGVFELLSERPENSEGVGVFYVKTLTKQDSRFNNSTYTDLLNPEAVKEFIKTTHDKYLDRFRYEFGEFFPGFVTESPKVDRNGMFSVPGKSTILFPWTPGFADFFKKYHGYSPLDKLHHLLGGGDGFAFRHDYYTAIVERFIESYIVPLSEWCSEHSISVAGLFPSQTSMESGMVADGPLMAVSEHLSIPGISQANTGNHTLSSSKEAAGIAHQIGRERILGTIFGDNGSQMSFKDMKHIADIQFSLGITSVEPQKTAYSIAGNRKYECGPIISYHQPYWERFSVMNDYLARCSWSVSQGHSTASVLLVAPYSAACGMYTPLNPESISDIKALNASYVSLASEMTAEHIAFDIGDERIISRHGKTKDDVLKIGNSCYSCVVFPPSPSWRSSTIELLERFKGRVFVLGEPAGRIDGKSGDRFRTFCERDTVSVIPDDPADAVKEICGNTERQVSVKHSDGSEARDIFVNHRRDGAAHIVFMANTSKDAGSEVALSVNALGGAVELDPVTGLAYRYHSESDGTKTIINTFLHPAGSRIFLVDQTQTSIQDTLPAPNEESLTINGPYAFRAFNDNSLAIDRCTLEIDDEILLENGSVRAARDIIWKKTGLTEFAGVQPWVLKERNIRSRSNQTILTFTFQIEEIPESIALAMETSDRFTIQINGETIDFSPGRWFIDRRCRVLNLEDHVVTGKNTITASTDYLWDTEISPPHIFGKFELGPASDGFPIRKAGETLNTGDWCEQGYPFYAGTIVYTMDFSIEKEDGVRYELDIAGAKGTVFSVTVNDKSAGVIPFAPYRGDITEALVNGDNTVEIEVAGSLKNAFHSRIDSESGNEMENGYAFIPYGLMSPPKLVKVKIQH